MKAANDEKGMYLYFYPALMTPSLIAMGLLFVETSINVTYYKDCVFALTNFFIFIGMFWVNHKAKSPHSNLWDRDDESNDYSDDNDMFYRQLEDTQKYDKVKIEKEGEKICAWQITFIVMTFIWVLVTLITDFQSVFYRKAIIYKRRIDTELEKRKISSKQSF